MQDIGDIVHCCQELAATTSQMCGYARSGQWERLAELDTRCGELSHRLRRMEPDEALSPTDRVELGALFSRIRSDQRELSALVRPQFSRLMAQVRQLVQQQELERAYRRTPGARPG